MSVLTKERIRVRNLKSSAIGIDAYMQCISTLQVLKMGSNDSFTLPQDLRF